MGTRSAYSNWGVSERAQYSFAWLEERGLGMKEWAALVAIAKRMNHDTGTWRMSYERIGRESLQSRQSAMRAVKNLVEAGAIEITKAKHHTGIHTFRVTLPDLDILMPPEELEEEEDEISPNGTNRALIEHDKSSLDTISPNGTR